MKISNITEFIDRGILHLESGMFKDFCADDELMGRLRAQQVNNLLSLSKFLMMVNVVNAIAVYASVIGYRFDFVMGLWFLSVFAYALSAMRAGYLSAKRGKRETVSIRTVRRIAVSSAFLGVLWGIMPTLALISADPAPTLMIVAVSAGMMGGGAIVLAFVPAAMFTYIIPITVLTFLGVLGFVASSPLWLGVLFVLFSLVLIRSCSVYARAFAGSIVSEVKVGEQAATIGILLREYEQSGRDWIWETDSDGYITRGMGELSQIVGVPAYDILQALTPTGSEQADVRFDGFAELRAMFRACEPIRDHVISIEAEGGERYWFQLSGKPLRDGSGELSGYRGVVSDITDQKRSESKVEYLAHYDAMTGLYNRVTFQEEVDTFYANRDLHDGCVLFYIDLDGFKGVNDTRGHAMGDLLLTQVASRMRAHVGSNQVLSRIGGDEFTLFVKQRLSEAACRSLAIQIIEELEKPFVFGDVSVSISASIGIAIGFRDGESVETLINAADIALYTAKADDVQRYCFYKDEMFERVRNQKSFEDELRMGLQNGEFSVHYQPFYDNETDRLVGFEALARWDNPKFGAVPPSQFIPVAERLGIIVELGDWILHEACRCASSWPENLSVAVNVSVLQFKRGKIVDVIGDVLSSTGLAPQRLEIEITERIFAREPEVIAKVMAQIREMGVKVSLDDFGTGFSSLRYLMEFPFDKLKVDRAFVERAGNDDSARALLVSIFDMCQKLMLKTTAEGIETADQHQMIRDIGYTYGQGFLLSKPVDETAIAAVIMRDQAGLLTGAKPAPIKRKPAKRKTG